MTSIPPPADQRDQRDHALTRRALLVVGAGAGSAAAVGRLAQGISPAANAAGSGAPTTADLQELDASISGSVVLPTASGYLSALQLFDPIYDGMRPLAVVQPAKTADVATTVRFASAFATPFAPRSGGHSYVGASGGDQGIQLDLRRLNSVTYNTSNRTVVVGAGAGLYSLHAALEPFARTVPTGTCATVGVSGLTLGGGIGFEHRRYGLTCDVLHAVRVVLANGSTVRASASQNADLFWACRGGGGGNFGIVTEYTFATRAATPVGYAKLRWTDADMERVIAGWQQRIATAPRTSFPVLHLVTGSGQVTPRIDVRTLGTSPTTEVDALIAAVGRAPATRTTASYTHLQAVQQVAGCTGYTDSQCQLQPSGLLTRKVYLSGSDILGRALTGAEISAISGYLRAWARTNSICLGAVGTVRWSRGEPGRRRHRLPLADRDRLGAVEGRLLLATDGDHVDLRLDLDRAHEVRVRLNRRLHQLPRAIATHVGVLRAQLQPAPTTAHQVRPERTVPRELRDPSCALNRPRGNPRLRPVSSRALVHRHRPANPHRDVFDLGGPPQHAQGVLCRTSRSPQPCAAALWWSQLSSRPSPQPRPPHLFLLCKPRSRSSLTSSC